MKTVLRVLLSSFIISNLSISDCKAQWVSIPDTALVNWLNLNGYDSCMNGNQMDTACSASVRFNYEVYMYNYNIRNSYGLQFLNGIDSLRIAIHLDSTTILPRNLISLDCNSSGVAIAAVPYLPSGLLKLDCGYNGLTSLPPLPNGLKYLNCMANHSLKTLPALPDSLRYLFCSYDSLLALPSLPNHLYYLNCEVNQITALPALPPSLKYLIASYNQISTVPELPDTLMICYLHDNPPLQCLPKLKVIVTLTFTNTSVTCVPNNAQLIFQSVPPLNTVPICELGNANGCPFYWNIRGRVYDDLTLNCTLDSNEVVGSSIPVKVYRNDTLIGHTYTVAGGYYTLETGRGSFTYSVDTSNLPVNVSCPAAGFRSVVINDIDSFVYDMDFGMKCKQGIDVGAWSVVNDSGMFRPNGLCKMQINAGDFYGLNCAAGIGGQISIVISGANYISAVTGALTPILHGDTVLYNIPDFGTVNELTDFRFVVQTEIGSNRVGFTVTISASADVNNANNVISQWFVVRNSFDPNDKQVYPFADIDTAQEWLTYTIRFQNTGTAEAQHIYVTDTLDSDLDVSSFQLLAYSHQPMVQLRENAVRFNFPNINLPDSNTNEPLSHGYVQYKVKLKDNLLPGTQINNTAFIYFDFNAAVVTNTTTNTIAVISSVGDVRHKTQDLRLFPNPANDVVTISIDESMIGSSAIVSDLMGRKMAAVELTTYNSSLTTSNFSSGVYFVTVTASDGGSATKKLVIQK